MTARLSRREFEALAASRLQGAPRGPRAPVGPYSTRCAADGEVFTTQAAETRHMNTTGHRCYALVCVEPVWRPRAAQIDPLVGLEWDRRDSERETSGGRWL